MDSNLLELFIPEMINSFNENLLRQKCFVVVYNLVSCDL